MAVYLVARLADDASPPSGLAEELRIQRATGAKHWLASVVLAPAVRNALTQLVNATAGASPSVAQAVRTVTKVAANQLDAAARLELERLAAELDSQTLAG